MKLVLDMGVNMSKYLQEVIKAFRKPLCEGRGVKVFRLNEDSKMRYRLFYIDGDRVIKKFEPGTKLSVVKKEAKKLANSKQKTVGIDEIYGRPSPADASMFIAKVSPDK